MTPEPQPRKATLLARLGPGFVTGASDDDPAGIVTYAQTGAQFGLTQLWTCFFTLPLMTVVQEMCGRIGLVSGGGLAGAVRKRFPRPVLHTMVALLVVANVFNIGADLGAMAEAARLFVPLPAPVLLLGFTGLTLLLEELVAYTSYAKYLKWLALSLLAYPVSAFAVQVPWGEVLAHTFKPTFSLDSAYLTNILAIFGTTISPYLFFWQASEEVEEEVAEGKLVEMNRDRPTVSEADVRRLRQDTRFGMLFSNVIMFFIILTAAATFGKAGIQRVDTAAEAAEALRPIGGDFAFVLFALGILSTGLLAVPILAGSASYAVAESFKWREGLFLKPRQARRFYVVLGLATAAGLVINAIGVPPFRLLYYSAILNGILAPPLILIILLLANDRRVVGEHTNSVMSNVLGGFVAAVMAAGSVALLVVSL